MGTTGEDVQAEDGIRLSGDILKFARMNRIDNGTRVSQLHTCADTVGAAAPTRIDEPDTGIMSSQSFREQVCIFLRMPDKERSAKTG